MLELKNVSVTHKSVRGRKRAGLVDVSLKLPKKGLVFVTGPSGSGKTTLLNVLASNLAPTKGEVLIDGVSHTNFSKTDLAGFRNTYTGSVFQTSNFIEHMTLEQNVRLALELRGKPQTSEQRKNQESYIKELFTKLGISGLEKNLPAEVSGGQLQRASIARALVTRPKLLFADELTSNLDDENRDEIYKILKTLSTDILVLAVTHDKQPVAKHADRVVKMDGGKITCTGVTDISPSSSKKEKQGRPEFQYIKTNRR